MLPPQPAHLPAASGLGGQLRRNWTEPLNRFDQPRTSRAKVDLPQPDLPTTPVTPAAGDIEIDIVHRRKQAALAQQAGPKVEGLAQTPDFDEMVRLDTVMPQPLRARKWQATPLPSSRVKRRHRLAANRFGARAARMKAAACG